MEIFRKKLNCEFSLARIEDQNVFSVLIRRSSLQDWIAILWMVLEELGCALIDGSNGRQCFIQFKQNDTEVDATASPLKIQICRNDIVVLASYLIRYYRDGVAEVDHIDFDAAFADERGYLTFRVEDVAPSLSGDEVHRLLGL